MRSSFSMFLLYHAYVYLEFLILACTIYILAPQLMKSGMELYQLDISENPLCVYQVSDRMLLPTMNMDTSNRNYQKIFDDILKLESMTGLS